MLAYLIHCITGLNALEIALNAEPALVYRTAELKCLFDLRPTEGLISIAWL
jgi:hypothetical protein